MQDIVEMMRKPNSISKHYNAGFISIISIIIVGQVLITNVFGELFGVKELSFKDWMLLIAVTSPVLLIGEIVRIVINKFLKVGENN